ncbi:hypothetical protein CF328_g3179 [Tilletia controversa]|nr:hypothetical protein CF328_g3179 [Tilletia controversa]
MPLSEAQAGRSFYQRNSFGSLSKIPQPRGGTVAFEAKPKVYATGRRDKIHELLNGDNALHFDDFTEAVGISKGHASYNKLEKLALGSLFPYQGRTVGIYSIIHVDEHGRSYPISLTGNRVDLAWATAYQNRAQLKWTHSLNAGNGNLFFRGFDSPNALSAVSKLCQLATGRLQPNHRPVFEYDSAPKDPSEGPKDFSPGSGGMPPSGGAGGVPPLPLGIKPHVELWAIGKRL